MNKNAIFLMPLGFFLIGIIFVLISFGMKDSRQKTEKLCTVPVVAITTNIIEKTSYSSMDRTRTSSWFPVYKYTYNDKTYEVQYNVGGNKSNYHIGDKQTIMVNPENPQQFYNANDQFKLIMDIFSVIGSILGIVGIIAYFVLRKM